MTGGISLSQDEPGPDKSQELRFQVLDSPPSVLKGDTTLPDALYLRNDKGEPIFIPKVRYAEFERYLKDRAGIGQLDVPTAIIDSIEVVGNIREGFAELNVSLTMSVTESTGQLIRMPLSLKNMNWVSQPKTEGGKTNLVVPGTQDEGLIWYVEPDGSEKYTLSLDSVVKTEQAFSESSLRLELPESAAQLKLDIPGRDLNVQWIGASGEVFQTEVLNESTRARIRGRGGIGTLVWRDQLSSRDLGSVEVDTTTRVLRSNDGKESIGQTRLRIVADNRVGPRELTIWLPENAKWNPSVSNSVGSHWSLIPWRPKQSKDDTQTAPPSSDETSSRERLQLLLSDRARGQVEEISIDWTLENEDPSSGSFTITGIEVEGVQRHEGHISIVMPTSTRISWLPSTEYSLVKQTPSNEVSDAIEYDFRFARQPIRLQAVIAEDESKMRWRPDYLVTLDQDMIRLQGLLTLPADPKLLLGLRIVGGAWRFDTAVWDKTGELIQTEIGNGNTLRFLPNSLKSPDVPPDENALPSNEPIVIRFSAYQPTPPTGDVVRLSFQLPNISTSKNGTRKSERGDGSLVIDHGLWKLEPAEIRFAGMVRSSEIPGSLRSLLSERTTSDLQILRFQSSSQEANWKARAHRSTSIVSAKMNTDLRIETQGWKLSRRWSIQSTGKALERLTFRIPATWVTVDEATGANVISDNAQFISDGFPLEMQVLDSDSDGWTNVEAIRNDWPSRFDLTVAYHRAMAIPSTDDGQSSESDLKQGIRLRFPQLAIQPPARISEFHSTIEVGPDLLCQLERAASAPIRCTNQDGQVEIPLYESGDSIDIAIQPWITTKKNLVDVQDVWLQTTINSQKRRERCVMRIRTKQSALTFRLPQGWSEATTNIVVNNQTQSLEPDVETGLYRLVLPQDEVFKQPILPRSNDAQVVGSLDVESKSIVVEFWNWFSHREDWSRVVAAELPSIVGSSESAPLLWQIIVPSTEHLWTSSSTLLSDQRWEWKNLGWHRQSNLSQEQIESEFGASVQPAIATRTNQYVFRTIGSFGERTDDPHESIRIIPRFVLWLPVAVTVLILTALWPKMGVFQHPWLLLAVVIFLALLSMTAPDMTILLVQAAIVSLLIVAMVKMLSWATGQRIRRRSVFGNRTLSVPSVRSPRANIDESAGTQPRLEGVGSISTPSTHAMEAKSSEPISEVRP